MVWICIGLGVIGSAIIIIMLAHIVYALHSISSAIRGLNAAIRDVGGKH